MRAKAGNVEQYDLLFKVVSHVQDLGKKEARRFLRLILIEARRSLEANRRDYVGPARASLEDVSKVLNDFLLERSNGVRLQIVCYAVFKSLADAFPNFGTVRSYPTNASDASSDRAGDVERLTDDKVDYAIEVKDRTLTLSDVEASILKARVADVDNLLFLVQANQLMDTPDDILKRAAHEFARGIDVNIAEAMPFFKSVLILLSPEQRATLLSTVHDALHELGAHYKHVQHWTNLMKNI
jgi:SacI restriction endonuclease